MKTKCILAVFLLSCPLCADETFSQFVSKHEQNALRVYAFPLEKE